LTIDHQPGHGRYGQVNLVDVVASSISEIVFETIQQLDVKILDEHIATNLLAGIISNTKGFQTHTVTPRSLSVASHLISAGARRDVIIRHLFQTKTLSALRVWGRALANIQASGDGRLVWTTVTREDLRLTEATPEDAAGALDELMVNTPTAETLALFIELNGDVRVQIATTKIRQLKLPAQIQPETTTYYTGNMPGPLKSIVAEIVKILTE
jgi:nanoRNase/pAp phosphatase (c-di-AMP/oligoRNAs hydrolase)